MNDPAIVAAADQAHAEAEHTLNKLISWWAENRPGLNLNRADEIAVLTHILYASSRPDYSALLATAIARLVAVDE
jgi:hypothetical protein